MHELAFWKAVLAHESNFLETIMPCWQGTTFVTV
jgi:hypothetical protein